MPPGKRFVCIHGHFYQPPRENPWLETVETQDTAAPYHDWNERICAECYAPNGAARVVNVKNQITRIVNNYARMSFNFGPTLLSWLRENAPRTYRMILDGESRSRQALPRPQLGHGAGLQPHDPAAGQHARPRHADPLGHRRLPEQLWRPPEGMWLPETAADNASLEALAANGIKFTVLAPTSASASRLLKTENKTGDGKTWTDTPDAIGGHDTPVSRALRVWCFDRGLLLQRARSRAIAFEGLLNSGDNFVARLKAGFKDDPQPQLVHVATDGESYGHHHKHGEMALAYALRLLEQDKSVKLTNYASFLEQFPPEFECEIVENTSWSCRHGVERWRSDCGCNGGNPGWNQAWRAPLRQALDELRDALVPLTEQENGKLFNDVWTARDAYIQVVLDRSAESVDRFFAAHQAHALN